MSEPLVVVIPHRLGKDEALRRIKDGLGRAKGEFAWLISIDQDVWTGDRLSFRASALGQMATGFIDVYEAGVRVEVTLQWLLARFDWSKGPVDARKEIGALSVPQLKHPIATSVAADGRCNAVARYVPPQHVRAMAAGP